MTVIRVGHRAWGSRLTMLVGCGDGEVQRGCHLKMIKHQARNVDGRAGATQGPSDDP